MTPPQLSSLHTHSQTLEYRQAKAWSLSASQCVFPGFTYLTISTKEQADIRCHIRTTSMSWHVNMGGREAGSDSFTMVSEFALLEIMRRISIDVLSILKSGESAYISEISIKSSASICCPPSSTSATSESKESAVQCAMRCHSDWWSRSCILCTSSSSSINDSPPLQGIPGWLETRQHIFTFPPCSAASATYSSVHTGFDCTASFEKCLSPEQSNSSSSWYQEVSSMKTLQLLKKLIFLKFLVEKKKRFYCIVIILP